MTRRAIPAFVICALSLTAAAQDDPILRAMRDELKRSLALKLVNLETPYFISYAIEEGDAFSATAGLGSLLNASHNRFRLPQVHVRVGDYKFDNTNWVGSGFHFGSRYDVERYPLDDSYNLLRRFLWLSTDGAYKSAVEAIARKRSALKNIAVTEQIPDFAHAQPVLSIRENAKVQADEAAWSDQTRSLSAIFTGYPKLKSSGVEFQAISSTRYLVNSEGAEVRDPARLTFIRARATGQCPDGMLVRDAAAFHSLEYGKLPAASEIKEGIARVAENITALTAAPMGETYNGPILFEGAAAAQLFAEVLGHNLALVRKPVMEPGRPGNVQASDLEGRQNSRILPEFLNVIDDPTQASWNGRPLLGAYAVDREGVAAQRLSLVEKGVLKNFLLTRQPMRGFEGSNGRARMPGNFGAETATFSNLIIQATEVVPLAKLKSQLLEMCQARSKPYGIIVRKMDYPSSATYEEVRRLVQSNQGGRPVSQPVLVYRVYPDGREELIRGVRFRGLTVRSLKDITAASGDSTVFSFLDNLAPFALMGAGGFVAEASVVAPSVLIDDVELHRIDDEMPKLPIVPPPS